MLGAQGREEGHRFLRFITYVAIGGVAVGVAALLLALSIVRGFSREIEAKIVGFGAHVQVENLQDAPLDQAGRMQRDIAEMEGVVHVAPVVTEFALLRRSSSEIEGVALWGTDALPPYLADHLLAGTASFAPDTSGRAGLVLGATLARQLDVEPGDRVTVFSMRNRGGGNAGTGTALTGRPRAKQFTVVGIYETALANFDEIYAFTSVEVARELLEYDPDQVTRLDLTLREVGPQQADAVALAVEEAYGFPVMARTIYQVFRGLFAWVNLQETIIPVVISVMIVVAAFNIVGTLLMIILEKTREIGVMASMGASRHVLRRLFLWLGLLIGTVGTGLGLGIALVLALLQQRYDLIPLPEEAYYMDTAPIELNPVDFVLVGSIALLLCVLSAYIPARFASRIEPLKVIRFS